MAVQQQPMGGGGGQMMVCDKEGHRDWDQKLFGCCGDFKQVVMACCCMYCGLCKLSKQLGDFPCMPFCAAGGVLAMRTRLRTMGGIRGNICNDYLALACCGPCALCQMFHEADVMGL